MTTTTRNPITQIIRKHFFSETDVRAVGKLLSPRVPLGSQEKPRLVHVWGIKDIDGLGFQMFGLLRFHTQS